MRSDPERLRFEIAARDGKARTGRLHTASGTVETPAFIPLATRGSVRGLSSSDVEDLGYEMVLGNTFHLLLSPGPDRIAASAVSTGSWDGSARSSPTPVASRSSRLPTATSPTR